MPWSGVRVPGCFQWRQPLSHVSLKTCSAATSGESTLPVPQKLAAACPNSTLPSSDGGTEVRCRSSSRSQRGRNTISCPLFPAIAILTARMACAGWRLSGNPSAEKAKKTQRANLRFTTMAGHPRRPSSALAATYFLHHTKSPAPNNDLATLLAQNPGDYALSMGHVLDLNAQALGLFRLPLAIAALSLFSGPLTSSSAIKPSPTPPLSPPAAGAFGFLLAAHRPAKPSLRSSPPRIWQNKSPRKSTRRPHRHTRGIRGWFHLGFYLQRSDIHILEGRSSNLWYVQFL